jgi:hypothetical protein
VFALAVAVALMSAKADARVQIDFAPLPGMGAQTEYKLLIEIVTAEGKGIEQKYNVGKCTAPADLAELVLESLPDGFDAKRDGTKLVVKSFKGKPITKVTAAGLNLPDDVQPKVGRPKK